MFQNFSRQLLAITAGLFLSHSILKAVPSLVITIDNPNRIGPPGVVEDYTGTITNNTGFTIDTTDLFLNFGAYDPVNVTLDQILGNTDIVIDNGTTSADTDLFTFTLANTAPLNTAFPAQVQLEDVSSDLSSPVTVQVSTSTPEPSVTWLAGFGLIALAAMFGRKRMKGVLVPLALIGTVGGALYAQTPSVQLVTGVPGLAAVATQPLMIALPILNEGNVTATNVTVTSVTLRSALASLTALPVVVGNIGVGQRATFQSNFPTTGLAANTNYLLTVRGTYQIGAQTLGFTLNRFVALPAAGPGSNTINTVTVGPLTTAGGPYPPQPPAFDADVNAPRPPIPAGPFVGGTPTGTPTGMPNVNIINGLKANVSPLTPVSFLVNSSLGFPSGGSIDTISGTAEPSGDVASSGTTVFTTSNWIAGVSTTSGSTFTSLDPTTVFPNDVVGFCCDQLAVYVPSIDRFIWILQGNGYRLASASSAQVAANPQHAWTYWNLTPQVFGQPVGTGFDYPDVSVGNNSLYISWDVGFGGCPSGCTSGHQVVRIPLSQIQAGGTISIGYTYPPDAGSAWGAKLTQDPGGSIYWAGQNHTSSLRVFSWAEGSGTYFWRDVGVNSWSNTGIASTTPDGQNWMAFLSGFPGNAVIGGAVSGSKLWMAWSAGTDNNFPQPHIEMVELDLNNNYNRLQQVQIWNSGFAFGYPALATNACTGEIGFSLEIGGGGGYENHAVGFWGDFTVYTTTNSDVGSTRFGDYVTIRQDHAKGRSAYFDALGYGIKTNANGGGTTNDVHYVVFGRSNACN